MIGATAHLSIFGRSWPTFQLCGLAGLVAGPTLAALLAESRGYQPLLVVGMAGLALGAFLGLALFSRWRRGREQLAFYPAESAALLLAALLLRLLGQPLLPYLDLLAIGLAGCYAFIRVGCHHAGCCHGRVARHGVIYGAAHVREGFPQAYADLPLFPLQALEALILAGLTAVAAVLFHAGSLPAGSVLAFWLGSYAVARFFLELLRADPETPFRYRLATPQWSALGRSLAAAALAGWIASPLLPGLIGGALLLVTATLWLLVRRQQAEESATTIAACHALAQALALAAALPDRRAPDRPREISHGLFCSCSQLEAGRVTLVTLSRRSGVSPGTIAAISAMISRLRPGLVAPTILASGSGIVHLVFESLES